MTSQSSEHHSSSFHGRETYTTAYERGHPIGA
ncbi:unnamed protein product, partial [Vitis vinifera]|uniref:Uncharacterized protein n=1 Tax=Vitis vinifera TaxID=29760 RepID=D7SXK4_VITVI